MNIDTVRQHLEGAGFPASKHDLVVWAKDHGAGTDELAMLEKLPVDSFDSILDLLGATSRLQKQGR